MQKIHTLQILIIALTGVLALTTFNKNNFRIEKEQIESNQDKISVRQMNVTISNFKIL